MELKNLYISVLIFPLFPCFGYTLPESLRVRTKATPSIEEVIPINKDSLATCEKEHHQDVSLDLSDLGMRKIKQRFISNTHVTCLSLQSNDIKEGNFHAFKNLPNLEYLNLANNKLDVVDFLSSGSHPNLKVLNLDHNEAPLQQIQHYDLYDHESQLYHEYNNYYNEWNQDNQNWTLPKLEHLYLRNIQTRRFPSISSDNFPTLTHLHLSDNNLNHWITPFLKKIPPTLTHLIIDRCNISSTATSNVSESLIFLSLDGNAFPCLNDDCMDFRKFTRLKFLSIASSNIEFVAVDSFAFNSDLLYLNLSKNRIRALLRGTFKYLSNLEVLNLNENRLSQIPDVCSLTKLIHLYINHNNIQQVNENSFGCIEELKFLSLSGNNIRFISPSTFDSLRNLVALDLSHNKLSQLRYKSSFKLEYLFLNHNLFTSFEDVVLGETSLTVLDLNSNAIGTLKPLSLKFLPENTTIYINSPILEAGE